MDIPSGFTPPLGTQMFGGIVRGLPVSTEGPVREGGAMRLLEEEKKQIADLREEIDQMQGLLSNSLLDDGSGDDTELGEGPNFSNGGMSNDKILKDVVNGLRNHSISSSEGEKILNDLKNNSNDQGTLAYNGMMPEF